MKRQSAIKTALFFFFVHSLYVAYVFGYVHLHQRPQDYLYWSRFFPHFDRPLVDLGFWLDRLFHFTGSAAAAWQGRGFSGHNLRYGVIHLLFGGLQWGAVGFLLGALFGSHPPRRAKAARRQDFRRKDGRDAGKGSSAQATNYLPASVPEDEELFVDGLAREGGASAGVPPARSDYLATESAGFVVRGERMAYFLDLRILKALPGETPEIRVQYESPGRWKKPSVQTTPFPPSAARLQLVSPPLKKGIRMGKRYTIDVSLYSGAPGEADLDRLDQSVVAYVAYRGGRVWIATGIEPRLRRQILTRPAEGSRPASRPETIDDERGR